MSQLNDLLVVVFQRGGADIHCEVSLYNDPEMARRIHPGTRLYPPGMGNPANGQPEADYLPQPGQPHDPTAPLATGLAPALEDLREAYDLGELAFVYATGTLDPNRSHFDQQAYMERAEGEKTMTPPSPDGKGWLRRHLDTVGMPGYSNGFRALSFSAPPVDSLAKGKGYLPIFDPKNFEFPTRGAALDPAAAERLIALEGMFVNFGTPLAEAFLADKEAFTLLNNAFLNAYTSVVAPATGSVVYPNTSFGKQMRDAAHIGKHTPEIEILSVDIGGWDTHQAQGVAYDPPVSIPSPAGRMDALMLDLAGSLKALRKDMAGVRDTTVIVQTEFGRTLDSNSSNGTDHGRGGLCMLMGPRVDGGRVVLPPNFAGLPAGLDLDVDCDHDMRLIQAEIAEDVLGHADGRTVVPSLPVGWTPLDLIT